MKINNIYIPDSAIAEIEFAYYPRYEWERGGVCHNSSSPYSEDMSWFSTKCVRQEDAVCYPNPHLHVRAIGGKVHTLTDRDRVEEIAKKYGVFCEYSDPYKCPVKNWDCSDWKTND